jgi:transcriptional regulator
MYRPPHFDEERVPVLHDFIRQQGFATLVTLASDGLIASHLPMLLDPAPAPLGTLRCHVARANTQWRDLKLEVPALVIFGGPQAYVSPGWYATKQETGKVVPTWNYAVVHAYGTLRIFEDADSLRALVRALTDRHEAGRTPPWSIDDAPAEFIDRQLKGIVGIEMPISRLEGKWKLSQNRPAADRAGVIIGLRELGDESSAAIADLMAAADASKS